MKKTVLDPFDEKYECCRDNDAYVLAKEDFFGIFICPTCARHWLFQGTELVLDETIE